MNLSIFQRAWHQAWRSRWLAVALVLIAVPFNAFGLVEPAELRFAEVSRRLAAQIFHANVRFDAHEILRPVTESQLGQGELPYTSTALGFALLGASDSSGRLVSLFWASLALISLWVVLGKLTQRFAQTLGVFALATLPPFVWQARLMLGDAATIGSLAVAMSGLSLACWSGSRPMTKLGWLVLGILGMVLGLLCRGVLIGVAVPALSVGIAGLGYGGDTNIGAEGNIFGLRGKRVRYFEQGAISNTLRRLPILPSAMILVGGLATVLGARALLLDADGYCFLLGAALKGPYRGGSFASEISGFLHAFFPWSALLPALLGLAISGDVRDIGSRMERGLASSFTAAVAFTIAAMGAMATRGVTQPFPAVTAYCGLAAIVLTWLHRRPMGERVIGATVASVAVLCYADFANLPNTRGPVPGVPSRQFAQAVSADGMQWLAAAVVILCLACALIICAQTIPGGKPFSVERITAFRKAILTLLSGPSASAMVLLETTLVTTALMYHAHERGFVHIHAFAFSTSFYANLLRYSWAIVPLVFMVLPFAYVVLRECATWVTSIGTAHRAAAEAVSEEAAVGAVSTLLRRVPRISSAVVLWCSLVVGGLLLSMGQMPCAANSLSAKATLENYRHLAKAREPLAFLGVGIGASRYYLAEPPTQLTDVAAAANWLAQEDSTQRYLIFGSELLGELNSAYRLATDGHNLLLPNRENGSTMLACSELVGSHKNLNPLNEFLPGTEAKLRHAGRGEWGSSLSIVGWEFADSSERTLGEIRRGQTYQLKLLFRVAHTPSSDWQIFVHLEGEGVRENGDHDPLGGTYPMGLWLPGDLVLDSSELKLEDGMKKGRYGLYVGFFRGQQRWGVTLGDHVDDRILLGHVTVN